MFTGALMRREGVHSGAAGGAEAAVSSSALQPAEAQASRKKEMQLACPDVIQNEATRVNAVAMKSRDFGDERSESPLQGPDENSPPQTQPLPPKTVTRPVFSGTAKPHAPPGRQYANQRFSSAAPKCPGPKYARESKSALCVSANLAPLCSPQFASLATKLKCKNASPNVNVLCACVDVYSTLIQTVADGASVTTEEPCSSNGSTPALPQARASLTSGEDWEADVTALTGLQAVAKHHPNWLCRPTLSRGQESERPAAEAPAACASLCVAFIVRRTQSLRSSVARSALRTAAALVRASRLYRKVGREVAGCLHTCQCRCPCCGEDSTESLGTGSECRCCAVIGAHAAVGERRGTENVEEEFWAICNQLLPILLTKAGATDKKFLATEAEAALDVMATCIATAQSSSLLASTVDHLKTHIHSIRTMVPAASFAQKVSEKLLEAVRGSANVAGNHRARGAETSQNESSGRSTSLLASPKRPREVSGNQSLFHRELFALPTLLLPLLLAFGRAQHAEARKAARRAIEQFASALLPHVIFLDSELQVGNSDGKTQRVLECLQTLAAAVEHGAQNKRQKVSGAQTDEASASCHDSRLEARDNLRLLTECVRWAVAAWTTALEGKSTFLLSPRMPLYKRLTVTNPPEKRKSSEAQAEFVIAPRVSLRGDRMATTVSGRPESSSTGREQGAGRIEEPASGALPVGPDSYEKANERRETAASKEKGFVRCTIAPSSLCHRKTASSEVETEDFGSSS
ncbi:hypothetical protein TGPRC2_253540 [Toxoplasma gondii TgCatPRC2]|uniref:Uncharacterized protein n=1 Tax=Toxoplasma gondii TgCatPRC2 TaxID=1130821 RepID=A0A151HDN8_TOXGO|nr:hypothetical protein TGPRC2_253540 [Toxoplasma gondii TgCatPRC2]